MAAGTNWVAKFTTPCAHKVAALAAYHKVGGRWCLNAVHSWFVVFQLQTAYMLVGFVLYIGTLVSTVLLGPWLSHGQLGRAARVSWQYNWSTLAFHLHMTTSWSVGSHGIQMRSLPGLREVHELANMHMTLYLQGCALFMPGGVAHCTACVAVQ